MRWYELERRVPKHVMAITKSAYLVSAIDVLKSGRPPGPLLGNDGRDPVAAALCMIPTTISRFCRRIGDAKCPCGQLWKRGAGHHWMEAPRPWAASDVRAVAARPSRWMARITPTLHGGSAPTVPKSRRDFASVRFLAQRGHLAILELVRKGGHLDCLLAEK